MLKNSKLQMLLGGIVLGGLLVFGVFIFVSPTQPAYANGECATQNDLINAVEETVKRIKNIIHFYSHD